MNFRGAIVIFTAQLTYFLNGFLQLIHAFSMNTKNTHNIFVTRLT